MPSFSLFRCVVRLTGGRVGGFLLGGLWAVTAHAQPVVQTYLHQHQQAPPIAPAPNPQTAGAPWIRIGIASQTLTFFDARGHALRWYPIATAKRGVGETENSYQTPRGWHRVCEKIGDNAPADTIISRRTVTPWQYTPALHAEFPQKDWILTRIIWLCGTEPGLNQGTREDGVVVDSYARYIYIHGAGGHVSMGTPSSLGCVRMTSDTVIDLFEQLPVGTEILIDEHA